MIERLVKVAAGEFQRPIPVFPETLLVIEPWTLMLDVPGLISAKCLEVLPTMPRASPVIEPADSMVKVPFAPQGPDVVVMVDEQSEYAYETDGSVLRISISKIDFRLFTMSFRI
ncbi:MAG: hypothetical protein BVN35_00010 [Proteobacteria bacterium ST_bin11]|nr:MAG: hypothetical protein BVN35_00010 [Proteobacteria bacterium ST_bin11]